MELPGHRLLYVSLILLLSVLSGCSSFELISWPKADVYESGEKIGRTPYSFSMLSGSRTFTLRRHGYIDRDVSINSVDSRQQHVNLQWIEMSLIESRPHGASVVRLEDGKVLGETPCRLRLARPVNVVFRLQGFYDAEHTLHPNRRHVVDLKPEDGFKSIFYRDIYFSSAQGAVAIYDRIAGGCIGVTPVRLRVEAGSELEYRLPGHIPEQVLISRNSPRRIEITLQPLSQVVLFGPADALVYREGDAVCIGRVPLAIKVDAPQLYTLKKEGFYDHTVAVSPDSPAQLSIEMEAIPYKTIITDPPGGKVYRLGGLEQLGTTPFTTVVENECVFEIRKEGFQPYIIGVGPTSPTQVSVPLLPVPHDAPDAAAIGELDSAVLDTF